MVAVNYLEYVARRVGFAVLSVYVVVTLTFGLVRFTPNTALGGRLSAARYYDRASPAEIREIQETFLEVRGLDEPLLDRYVGWLVDVATLDWGYSFAYNEPVWSVLERAVPTTLEYVLPGVLLAVALGVSFGLASALVGGSRLDWGLRIASYVLLGVPSFVAVFLYAGVTPASYHSPAFQQPYVATHVDPQVVAAGAVAIGLFAGQLRFARVASLEQAGEAFVKLLRAKGAGRVLVARHVLRNAALPIVSLSLTELLGVLMLNIYVVEEVLAIDGLAGASLAAVRARDFPLVVGTTMVLVFVGVGGSLLQDLAYGYLDPEVRGE
ncbi:MAG: ABC transporter permease [Halobacterium sp.]